VWNPAQRVRPGEVHVWILRIDCPHAVAASVSHLLSIEERARAKRFHFDRDRIAFTVTRASLRILLANQRRCDPARIQFGYGPAGKPSIEGGPLFNVSHSGAYAMVAIAHERQIGIDIEQMSPRPAGEELSWYFSGAEERAVVERSGPDRTVSFYSCWTRKEAFLKARGDGLEFGLDQFTVSVAPEAPALRWVAGEPDAPGRWQLRDLNVPRDYAGAIAAEGHDWELKTWAFEFPWIRPADHS
jgi:4'-phosphopantetheinyl transferase